MKNSESRKNLLKSIGPGILLAGAAIGGFHLLASMILSFLAAPVFAVINYRIVTADFMPAAERPGRAMRILSWIGILFLSGFSLIFMISRFAGS